MAAASMPLGARAAEPVKTPISTAVKTAAAESIAVEIPKRHSETSAAKSSTRESSGWGMLAAGLCVALLIVSRRRG